MTKNACRRTWGLILLLLFAGRASSLRAQDVRVPVEVQFDLFSKILIFDRNLHSRANGEIVFGIVYQSHHRASVDAAETFRDLLHRIPGNQLSGLPVRIVMIDLEKSKPLDKAIETNGLNILYVPPLRAFDIKTISTISRARKILTLTGVPDYSRSDLSVSVDSAGGKPQVLINLTAATAEGCDFSSKLLNLVTIVGTEDGEKR